MKIEAAITRRESVEIPAVVLVAMAAVPLSVLGEEVPASLGTIGLQVGAVLATEPFAAFR